MKQCTVDVCSSAKQAVASCCQLNVCMCVCVCVCVCVCRYVDQLRHGDALQLPFGSGIVVRMPMPGAQRAGVHGVACENRPCVGSHRKDI